MMMSDTIVVAIIAATPPTLVALGALVVGLMNRGAVHDVHVLINSRMTDWIEAAKKLSHSEGRAEGIQSEKENGKHENS